MELNGRTETTKTQPRRLFDFNAGEVIWGSRLFHSYSDVHARMCVWLLVPAIVRTYYFVVFIMLTYLDSIHSFKGDPLTQTHCDDSEPVCYQAAKQKVPSFNVFW